MKKKDGTRYSTEKEKGVFQMQYRLHRNDKVLLKKLLRDDNLFFQTLIDATVQAYLRGDPAILTVIQDWRDLNVVPDEVLKKGGVLLSRRERLDIMKQIEEGK